MIVSLTVVNLVASWILLPLVVVDTLLQPTETTFLCTTIDALTEFTTSASIFATVMIAGDRYCAVNQPLHYPMLMNRYKCGAMIAVSWILASVIAATASFSSHASRPWKACQVQTLISPIPKIGSWTYQSYYTIINLFVSFVIPLIAILWMYTRIFKEAEKNSERARRSSLTGVTSDPCAQRELTDVASSIPSSPVHTSVQTVNMIRHRISNASMFVYKEEFRAAKISVTVFVMFIICWFPYYFTALLQCDLLQIVIPYDLHSMVLVMSLSNCVTSPYMYLYRSRRIKREIHRLVGLSFKSSAGGTKRNVQPRSPMQLDIIPASPVVVPNENIDPVEGFRFPKPDEPPSPMSSVAVFINKIISMREFICNNWTELINFSLHRSSIPIAGSSTSQETTTHTFPHEYSLVPS
ncbi:unnamed protein product [Meganyctiphanes norvegica]|uniref:G-protein coupled receptors family 1 profile domain-containing protein n=1 Tax=Meganyctiphanes norvegica TaxID=48144 RepID=A0AAV2QY48_MEGNR